MRNWLILGLGLLIACTAQERPKAPEKKIDTKRLQLPNAINSQVTRVPTNPEGGLIPGQATELSVEESAARQSANAIKPIVFGVGAAGITMDMRRSEVLNLLANPTFVTSDGIILFPEFVTIVWQKEGEDPKPEAIIVNEGYKGRIDLPAGAGSLEVGGVYPQTFASDASIDATLLGLGAIFNGKAPDYDCEVEGTCVYSNNDAGENLFFFPKGILIFDKDAKLVQIIFQNVDGIQKRTRAPIVYGTSIGGIGLDSLRADVEAKLGPSFETEDKSSVYDNGSLLVTWGEDNKPLSIQGFFGLKGQLTFSDTFTAGLGQSFADPKNPTDDGKGLMIFIDRLLHKRAEGFDCSKQTVPLCSFQNDGNNLIINLEKASFVFTADADRFWIGIEMKKK